MVTQPQPSIYLSGIRIDEPIGVLTDIIVAMVCFYAFYKLTRRKIPGRAQLYFRCYFLLLGISTLLGGLAGHGFLYALSIGWKLPGWIIGMVSVALVERSAIAHARPLIKPKIGLFFLIANLVELFVVMAITMITLDFEWVGVHSAFGLVAVVTTLHAYTYYRTRDRGSLLILAGVLISGLASLVFSQKISIHRWFNFLDISHVLLAVAAYVFYLGALNLQKRNPHANV